MQNSGGDVGQTGTDAMSEKQRIREEKKKALNQPVTRQPVTNPRAGMGMGIRAAPRTEVGGGGGGGGNDAPPPSQRGPRRFTNSAKLRPTQNDQTTQQQPPIQQQQQQQPPRQQVQQQPPPSLRGASLRGNFYIF